MNVAELKLKPYAKLAALGALGVSGGTLALFLFMAYFTRATATSGIDQTESIVAWIAMAIPALLIIAAHLVYVRVLLDYAKEP